MKDNRSKTSAENGKKGGRPVSESVIRALKARDYISAEVEKQMSPIVAKAINDAILGDKHAREWLSDRAWGKPIASIAVTNEDGIVIDDDYQAKTEAILARILGGDEDTED